MKHLSALQVLLFVLSLAWVPFSLAEEAGEPPPVVAPAKPPYTVPWQLRPIMAIHVVRLDSAIAHYSRGTATDGLVAASVLTAAYRLIPDFAILIRLGMVNNAPPPGNPGASAFLNPLIGAVYSLGFAESFRTAFFFGMTAPVGMGGGNFPNAATQSANSAGVLGRSAMDNALFAPNYMTLIPGASLAYINHGLTVQLEATLLQLIRVQGDRVDADPLRTNFTSGLAMGYSFIPAIAAIAELRYQRWLENPTMAAHAVPAVDNLSFAIGPRFTIKAGPVTMRPGVAYAQGILGPIATSGFTSPTHSDRILFLDLPVFF